MTEIRVSDRGIRWGLLLRDRSRSAARPLDAILDGGYFRWHARPGTVGLAVGARRWRSAPRSRLPGARCPPSTPRSPTTFERAELGASWNATSAEYRIADGKLEVANAYNHPAWLRRRLPHDVVVDVDATSKSPAGDLKLELFGDGESFDPDKGSYVSTGYVLIFGGWHNSLSVICRQQRARRRPQGGAAATSASSRAEATTSRSRAAGGTIDWAIDGRPFLAWTDPEPLAGPGHEYLAVNDWEADVTFDNLKIRPAPDAMDEPPQGPGFDLDGALAPAGGRQVDAHLHARQPRSRRAGGRPRASGASPSSELGVAVDPDLRRDRRSGPEPGDGRQPQDAARAGRGHRSPTRSTSSRSSTASRRPATTRCRPTTASTSSSTTTRLRPGSARAPWCDIRPELGATSTIVFEYLRARDVPIDAPLATAFFFALRTETRDLGRESTEAERRAYLALVPLVDHSLLYRMTHPKVPRAHFAALDRALRSAQLFGDVVAVNLGALGYPDLVAEIADLLLSYEGARYVLCIGQYGEHAYLSLRTEADDARAGSIMRHIVAHDGAAGGHGTMAGARLYRAHPLRGGAGGDVRRHGPPPARGARPSHLRRRAAAAPARRNVARRPGADAR